MRIAPTTSTPAPPARAAARSAAQGNLQDPYDDFIPTSSKLTERMGDGAADGMWVGMAPAWATLLFTGGPSPHNYLPALGVWGASIAVGAIVGAFRKPGQD